MSAESLVHVVLLSGIASADAVTPAGTIVAVRADVAGVQKPLSSGLYEQGVGVERTVVHQIRRDAKRSELKRVAVMQESGERKPSAARREERRFGEHSMRGLAHVDRGQRTFDHARRIVGAGHVGLVDGNGNRCRRKCAANRQRHFRRQRFDLGNGSTYTGPDRLCFDRCNPNCIGEWHGERSDHDV